MNDEKAPFAKSLQDLLTKSIEANKVFMNEGARVFKQFTSQDASAANLNLFQNETITNAFNEYVKLNVNYFNSLIDVGLNAFKNISTTNTGDSKADSGNAPAAPGFVLQKSTEPGSVIHLQFLLDNVKQENVICELVHSAYIAQPATISVPDFKTDFTPQQFALKPGESAPVNINISVPENAEPGLYTSNVKVKGFEPAYFSILLTVTEKQKIPTTNG